MTFDNGVPQEVVERELRIAKAVSEMLYVTNQRRGKLGAVDMAYSIAQRLGLLQVVKNILRCLGLEQAARKMMTRSI